MTYTYVIPADIQAILKEMDYLGFDTAGAAMNAIIAHRDWQERWDVAYATQFYTDGRAPELVPFIPPHKIQAMVTFRRSTVNQIRAARATWFAADVPDEYDLVF